MASCTQFYGVWRKSESVTFRLFEYFFTPNENFSSPAIANDVIYWGSLDGNLYALDTRTGDPRWQFPTQGIVFSAPAIADRIVYFGSFDRYLYAVDSHTGRQKWRFLTGGGVSSPAVSNGVVYVGSDDGVLYALH